MNDNSKIQVPFNAWLNLEPHIEDHTLLREFWVAKFEEAIPRFVACNIRQSFVLALLKLHLKARSRQNVTVNRLAKLSGYSKSTFFRKFNTFLRFQYDVYQLLGQILIDIYHQNLLHKRMDPLEFSEFTINFFYSSYCSLPVELVSEMWNQYSSQDIYEFHPHLKQLPPIILNYISKNEDLGFSSITRDELLEFILIFDKDLLNRCLSSNDSKPNAAHCRSWKAMLHGFLTEAWFRVNTNYIKDL